MPHLCFGIFLPKTETCSTEIATLLIAQPFGNPSFSESIRPLNTSDSSKYLNIFTGIRLRSHDSLLSRVIQSQSVQYRQRRQRSSSPEHAQEGQESDKWYTCTGDFIRLSVWGQGIQGTVQIQPQASVKNVKDTCWQSSWDLLASNPRREIKNQIVVILDCKLHYWIHPNKF